MSFNKNDSIIYKKAFDFSLDIFKIYEFLKNQKEYDLARQILKSSTSIAANIREGLEGQRKKDFIAKFSIALKEAAETEYWLEFLIATDVLSAKKISGLSNDLSEIIKILNSILNTSKNTER